MLSALAGNMLASGCPGTDSCVTETHLLATRSIHILRTYNYPLRPGAHLDSIY